MTENFQLLPALQKKDFVADLQLCRVLMENNRHYPWIFLIPRRENIPNLRTLSAEDRLQLMREMGAMEEIMASIFPCRQTNIAMIGNRTPQLHVHIICRREDDPDWPGTVWEGANGNCEECIKEERIQQICDAIRKSFSGEK